MGHPQVGVRQAAMQLLEDAFAGLEGGGSYQAYTDAVKVLTRYGVTDRTPAVRAIAANCLRAIAVAGGPGLGGGGLETLAAVCVKVGGGRGVGWDGMGRPALGFWCSERVWGLSGTGGPSAGSEGQLRRSFGGSCGPGDASGEAGASPKNPKP